MRAAAEDAPVLIAARRTAIGTAGRSLAGLTAADLAAPVIRTLADELGLPARGLWGGGHRVSPVSSRVTAGLS